jgi:hypothetical protein
MASITRSVHQDLDAFLLVNGEPTLPVATRLTYDPADPYGVSMRFQTGTGAVTWTFARDLLFDGMRHRSGDGDVLIEPDAEALRLVLTAPSGTAEFALDAFDVAVFLEETVRLVPRGQETHSVDLDGLVERLLATAD